MRLNLGCGPTRIEGYTSIDISEQMKPDIVADVADLPMEDNSVDVIFASHILEHFRHDVPVLAEWHRVLKPGGEIHVMVPDFLQLYELYRCGNVDLNYLMATFYGAQLLGYPEEYEHKQTFTASMLVDRMKPYFPDASMVGGCEVRHAFIGEAMVEGHKP